MKSFESIAQKSKKSLLKEDTTISPKIKHLVDFCDDVMLYLNKNISVDNLKQKYNKK
jgi:hypothetical protein